MRISLGLIGIHCVFAEVSTSCNLIDNQIMIDSVSRKKSNRELKIASEWEDKSELNQYIISGEDVTTFWNEFQALANESGDGSFREAFRTLREFLNKA